MEVSLAMLDPNATNPGPIESSILYDQDKHVSSAIWEGQERGALRCHEHTSKLDQWMLTATQLDLVDKAGFGYLRLIPAISLDNPLISALVERWRRETNTFHFTVGEMTVTLKDVALLLGLAIDGDPVIGITYTSCNTVCERYLGRAPEHGYASGGMVKLSWLKENFSRCPEDATMEDIERHTRAYLLYLVGSTIFSTTTGNKVPVMYLPLFENFDQAGRYAWGAAALAFLYRALGNASLKSQSTISGCLTLLQSWSYFHLNIGRPKLNKEPRHDCFPFVLRWKGKQNGPTPNRDVIFYRKSLDSLKSCDVDWLPYRDMDGAVIPEEITGTLILGRSKTMLICFDKAERHLPDRCLRQYGMLQPIPQDVLRWERKSRGVDGGVDLSGKMESELNEWFERRLQIVESEDGVDENEYMQWYMLITRKFVGRPISLSTEFQRTNGGLREIAELADTFSTNGLDPQQIDSIGRIRLIAHECLRDQVGSPITMTAVPQIELGKRLRGKERVRRKNTTKRKRKDDPMQYAASEDESQFCSGLVEVDQLHLCHVDNEVDHSQLCHVAGDDLQLCHEDSKVDESQLYHVENHDVELGHAVGEDNDDKQSFHAAIQANEAQHQEAAHNLNDSEICNTVKIDSSLLHNADNKVDDSELCDTSNKIDDSLLIDTTKLDGDIADESATQPSHEAVEDVPQPLAETSDIHQNDVVQQNDCSIVAL